MQLGEIDHSIVADRTEYTLLHAHKAPAPLEVLMDERAEGDPITGAAYSLEDIGLLSNAVQRAKEQAMQALFLRAQDLASDDPSVRRAAIEEIRRAVLSDDGTRSKLMRTAIISSTMLDQLEGFRE